jgi:hypothetical protein
MTDASPKLTLPEYEGNAFIRALQPPPSQKEIYRQLLAEPVFDSAELNYPAVLRKHCVLRLARLYRPMARQVQLADRIGMAIRQGYIGRNPDTGDYFKHLHAGVERIEAKSISAQTAITTRPTGCSLTLIGCSGSGKSETVERTLKSFPQLIQHETPYSLIQIVWLKLDTPTQGSPKQLCINFFAAVDQLLGTDYMKRYGSRGHAAEYMLVHMAHVASLHALGVLVVDEIQNLARTAIGPEALLNFLVLLINTIGIPVFVVGTLGALPIVQRNFRQARRSTGLATAIWDRVPKGDEWDAFVTYVWKYQWTREPSDLTPEIRDVLYDESQGIIDVLVKLIMLAQLRLISIAEIRPNTPEMITSKLLRAIARDHFQIIRPMMEALRKNNMKALEKYDDLVPLQVYVNDVVQQALGGIGATPHSLDAPSAKPDPEPSDDVASAVARSLVENGVAEDVAVALVTEIAKRLPDAEPLDFLASAIEQLRGSPPKAAKSKSAKKPAPNEAALDDQDLRRIVSEGEAAGKEPYEALKDVGLIGIPASLLAA